MTGDGAASHQLIWFAAALSSFPAARRPRTDRSIPSRGIERSGPAGPPHLARQPHRHHRDRELQPRRAILGHPRITYESEQATDNDRLEYRIAVMEALQRCTPMPFTESMAGAVAGRPFAIQFHNRKPHPNRQRKEHG